MTTPDPSDEVVQNTEERRETPRRRRQIKVLLTDAEARAEPTHAWLIDRSIGGLCFSVSREMAVGTVLNVRPGDAPETMAWLPVEVKSCRPVETTWEVGCQFLHAPSYSVLLQFG